METIGSWITWSGRVQSNFLEKRRLLELERPPFHSEFLFYRQEVKMSDSDSGVPPIKRCRIAAGYEKSWEKIPEVGKWLARSPKGREFGRCRCCNEDFSLDSGLASLAQHCMQWSHFFCLMKVPYQHRQNLVKSSVPVVANLNNTAFYCCSVRSGTNEDWWNVCKIGSQSSSCQGSF